MEGQTETTSVIRIGTRGSRLALAQAAEMSRCLAAADPDLGAPGAIEIVVIRTTGDVVRDRRLADIGGKGLFMKEIEEALIAGQVDLAIHSMKDVETILTPGTEIGCILPREDARDAFLSHRAQHLRDLPAGAVIGTSSVRRAALIGHRRPDVQTALFRGNVDTRLARLDGGEVDATLLAHCGLKRLGLEDRATCLLEPEEFPPAVGQGAIGAQCRRSDAGLDGRIREWLATVNHLDSARRVEAERAMLARLGGSCRTPIAGHATLDGAGGLRLVGHVITENGERLHRAEEHGGAADAAAIGAAVGAALLASVGDALPQ